jgi:hypothetical protein
MAPRPLVLVAILGLLAAGCRADEPAATSAPLATLDPTADSAIELLQCEGAPSPIGGTADDFGPTAGGSTPDAAFAAFISEPFFVIPRSGYTYLGQTGDRHVWAYRTDGRVLVVVVISQRFAEMVNARFTVEELRACELAEFGRAVDLGPEYHVWSDQEGNIISDIAGPSHCGWESARLMHIEVDGRLVKQYVRDPEGVIAGPPLLEPYAEDVPLPGDATFSGYTSAEGDELWFTPGDEAAYVVRADGVVERWPRPTDPIGCA